MPTRNWTLTTLSALAALIFTLIFTVNIVIDPYGEFRIINTDFNRLKFKAQKTSALNVAAKLYDGKYTLIFGSSRTMLVSEEILGEPTLNFSTSIYNNPGDVLALLQMLDKKQIQNIKKTYFLVDINGFHYLETSAELSSKPTLLLETIQNIGPEKFKDSWNCLIENITQRENQPNSIDDYGVLHKEDKPYKDKQPFFSSHYVTLYYLQKLKEIASFCENKQIEIIFYTAPWAKPLVKKQQILLSKITDKITTVCPELYYLFLNTDITGDNTLFTDPSHLNSKGLKKLFHGPYWKAENIKQASGRKYPNSDFTTINHDDFSKYVMDNYALLDASLFNQISAAKREDLIIAMYDSPLSKKKLVSDCFLLGKTSLLKKLISNGRSFNNDQSTNDLCLSQAIMSGDLELIKAALLLGANINSKNSNGEAALSTAMHSTKGTEIVKLLIQNGADGNYINKSSNIPQSLAHSAFTIALQKGDKEKLSLLNNHFGKSPLAEHASLILELEKHPDNSTAFTECSKLQDKYYNLNNTNTARIFIIDPKQTYIKEDNGQTFLCLPQKTYEIDPEIGCLFNNINVSNRIIDIADKVFSETPKKHPPSNTEMQKQFTSLVVKLYNLIHFLEKQNVIKRLN